MPSDPNVSLLDQAKQHVQSAALVESKCVETSFDELRWAIDCLIRFFESVALPPNYVGTKRHSGLWGTDRDS